MEARNLHGTSLVANPLHVLPEDDLLPSIVELGGPTVRVIGDVLRSLDRATFLKKASESATPQGVRRFRTRRPSGRGCHPNQADPPNHCRHRPQLRRPGTRLSGVRDPGPRLAGACRDYRGSRFLHRVISALRVRSKTTPTRSLPRNSSFFSE